MSRYSFLCVAATVFLTACTSVSPFTSESSNTQPRPDFSRPLGTQVLTLEQARRQASFHMFEPTYLPNGFRIHSVVAVTPSVTPPETHYTLLYIGPVPMGLTSLSFLNISEEYWPPQLPSPVVVLTPPPFLTPAPKVSVHGVSAYLSKDLFGPSWFTPEPPEERYLSLLWVESNVMLSVGGSLGLDELTRIAESLK
jgi:hypothetical protein